MVGPGNRVSGPNFWIEFQERAQPTIVSQLLVPQHLMVEVGEASWRHGVCVKTRGNPFSRALRHRATQTTEGRCVGVL